MERNMEQSSHAGSEGAEPDFEEHDCVAEAASALADAFREANALFEIAAIHNRGVAASCAQRLREALMMVLVALVEARRARRRASG
jgi:hypothetical protein